MLAPVIFVRAQYGRTWRKRINITLSIDQQVAQGASLAAQKMGKTLNQTVGDYLEQLAGGAHHSQEWDRFEARCLASTAKPEGCCLNRDVANSR